MSGCNGRPPRCWFHKRRNSLLDEQFLCICITTSTCFRIAIWHKENYWEFKTLFFVSIIRQLTLAHLAPHDFLFCFRYVCVLCNLKSFWCLLIHLLTTVVGNIDATIARELSSQSFCPKYFINWAKWTCCYSKRHRSFTLRPTLLRHTLLRLHVPTSA